MSAFQSLRDVGVDIFPVGERLSPDASCVDPPKDEKDGHVMMSKTFKWSADSRRVVLLDRLDTQVNVVMVRKRSNGGFETFASDINRSGQICAAEACVMTRADIQTFDEVGIGIRFFSLDGGPSQVINVWPSSLLLIK
jgi:hypothetical protein